MQKWISYPPKIRGFSGKKRRKAFKMKNEEDPFCKSYPQIIKNSGGQLVFIHNSVDKRLKKYTFAMYKRLFRLYSTEFDFFRQRLKIA